MCLVCLGVLSLCVGFPGTGVPDSCELSCGCWELNLSPLEKQSVFLTSEPSLQPPRALNLNLRIRIHFVDIEFSFY